MKNKRQQKRLDVTDSLAMINEDIGQFDKAWYNIEYFLRTHLSNAELKKEAVKWAKDKKEYSGIKNLKDYEFLTFGKLCFILNKGAQLSEKANSYFQEKLKELIVKSKNLASKDIPKQKNIRKNLQDQIKETSMAIAGEVIEPVFDEFIKNKNSFTVKNKDVLCLLRENETKIAHARLIKKEYEKELEEISLVLDMYDDKSIKEYYGCYSKQSLKEFKKFLEIVINSCDIIVSGIKRRKKKTPKEKSKEALVKNIRYLQEDKKTGLASVPMHKVLGAKELWFYNTKTQKLGRIVANDASGLGVSRSSIVNVDEKKSTQKHLRKPFEQLKMFKDGGVRKYRNSFANIKSKETKIKTFRTNANTVYFRVF